MPPDFVLKFNFLIEYPKNLLKSQLIPLHSFDFKQSFTLVSPPLDIYIFISSDLRLSPSRDKKNELPVFNSNVFYICGYCIDVIQIYIHIQSHHITSTVLSKGSIDAIAMVEIHSKSRWDD